MCEIGDERTATSLVFKREDNSLTKSKFTIMDRRTERLHTGKHSTLKQKETGIDKRGEENP